MLAAITVSALSLGSSQTLFGAVGDDVYLASSNILDSMSSTIKSNKAYEQSRSEEGQSETTDKKKSAGGIQISDAPPKKSDEAKNTPETLQEKLNRIRTNVNSNEGSGRRFIENDYFKNRALEAIKKSPADALKDVPSSTQPRPSSPGAPARPESTERTPTGIPVIKSGVKRDGTRVNSENPSVRHVKMAPATKAYGGDDIEIIISPIYDVLLQMPSGIEFFRASSSQLLTAQPVAANPAMITLKVSAEIAKPTPISLHIVDVSQNIYTFTIIGYPTDLSIEYPKTVIVSRRMVREAPLGASNPESLLNAMDISDAIQIVVGDIPRTDEYEVEFVSAKYMHYQGYIMYGFRVFRKDRGNIDEKNLTFTAWADSKRLTSEQSYGAKRDIEWVIEPTLSRRESRRRGYEVARVFVQIRASILELERWQSAFLTVADDRSFTKFDFQPFIRAFRSGTRDN